MLYVVNKHPSDQMIDYNQMNEGISGKRENMKTNQTSLFVKVASAWLHLLHCCSCSAVFQQHSESEYSICFANFLQKYSQPYLTFLPIHSLLTGKMKQAGLFKFSLTRQVFIYHNT